MPGVGRERTDAIGRHLASVVAQRGEGLAAGLTSVFAHFGEGHQRRIIAFNSDSPHLPRSVLENAFDILSAHDVVVGPTYDGGYYLVGAKAHHPTLFANDGMGTSSALERLLSRARTLQLAVGFADHFYDIDVADDLTRLAEDLRLAPTRAPRTAAWLKEWERVADTIDEWQRKIVTITPASRVYILGITLCVALTICSRSFSDRGGPYFMASLTVAGIAYLLAVREFFATPRFDRRVLVIGLLLAAVWHIAFLRLPTVLRTMFIVMFGTDAFRDSATIPISSSQVILRRRRCTPRKPAT